MLCYHLIWQRLHALHVKTTETSLKEEKEKKRKSIKTQRGSARERERSVRLRRKRREERIGRKEENMMSGGVGKYTHIDNQPQVSGSVPVSLSLSLSLSLCILFFIRISIRVLCIQIHLSFVSIRFSRLFQIPATSPSNSPVLTFFFNFLHCLAAEKIEKKISQIELFSFDYC